MRTIILAMYIIVFPVVVTAAGEHVKLDKAPVNLENKASLQRGAKYFVNYCLNCHSAVYMRYQRMAQDLGLTERQVLANLMFSAKKIGETMQVSIPADDAKKWFGTVPPDLTLVARSRGADWLYTYLRSFYLDKSRPFGVNNLVFKDVGMPDVLWELQGMQKAVFTVEEDETGHKHEKFDHFELVRKGSMTPDEYDQAVGDLVNFLAYMGEPAKLDRQRLGVWVMVFLVVFFIIAYQLKKEYWKDIH